MKSSKRTYETEQLRVTYDTARCIHAAECVHGLPEVFDPDRRPWIDVSRGSPDEVARVVTRCPTGALSAQRLDGGAAEASPTDNTVTVCPDGPLYVNGNITIRRPGDEELLRDVRVALCRCGASHNKPLCDGRHADAGFRDDGTLQGGTKDDEGESGGEVTITVQPDGPLLLRGNFRIVDGLGVPKSRNNKAALCRCGFSYNKPFCDGSHADEGFRAE
jgi:CDGSH-type Zn-finger protein/uncharacterized Fe-S cluster protein YjdI